ncbi:MAG: sorting protein [Candidatus Nitrosotenuis sp.]|nr:sorting protein [Candidatus Nitrosotenuis sp.]
MNSYALYVLIAIMAAAGTLAIVPTYAASFDEDIYEKAKLARQNDVPITVMTENKVYDHNSEIHVQGTVANLRGDAVTIKVTGPQGNIVALRQVEVSEDNSFEATLSTAGSLWKQSGMYTIRAQYGPQQVFDKVVVEITEEAPEEPACAADELVVKGRDQAYCVPFEITGGTVSDNSVSSETSSLTLMITAESDGSVSLKIPRNVLDARQQGMEGDDTDFIVLVDGEEADFEEIDTTSDERTLDIVFLEGATQIEVIGTWAVPEFGTTAAIILAVAIVSIIAVSARTRLSILPRY